MNGFTAYRYYLALKLHFTTDKFNVFENKGNVRGSYESFAARNDKHLFDKLARKFNSDQELIQFMVSQFVYGNTNFIYELEQADDHYIQWCKVKQSITKVFQDDLNQLQLEAEKNGYTYDDLFNCTLNDFPVIIKLYLGKRIHPQTLAILSNMGTPIGELADNPSLGLILDNELRVIYKMSGFFKYDKEKLSKIFNEFIANCDVGLINKSE
jgi:hypothetical protein